MEPFCSATMASVFRGQRYGFDWFPDFPLLSAWPFKEFAPLSCDYIFFRLILVANYVLRSLSIGSGGTKFEIFPLVKMLLTCTLCYVARPDCLQVQKM